MNRGEVELIWILRHLFALKTALRKKGKGFRVMDKGPSSQLALERLLRD
jgi:hypothetical protein